MDYIFDDWKKAMGDFLNCVEKDVEEIHKQKIAMQQRRPISSSDWIKDSISMMRIAS